MLQNSWGDYVSLYKNEQGGFCPGGTLSVSLSVGSESHYPTQQPSCQVPTNIDYFFKVINSVDIS